MSVCENCVMSNRFHQRIITHRTIGCPNATQLLDTSVQEYGFSPGRKRAFGGRVSNMFATEKWFISGSKSRER